MSGSVLNAVRRGFYLDSVALMRLSREIGQLPGITEAALMMGSPANKTILCEAGLLRTETSALNANDLIIAVKAVSEDAATVGIKTALEALNRPKSKAPADNSWRPRSIAAALRELPDANLVLISVPGEFAAAEARKALRRGLHVMIFSDNVSLADERALKLEARERGLLVMGPDCGTAIIGGKPLAFANRVNRGSIGIVGASGTGTQEVSCLISEASEGVSHAIGVGGRDLKREVGGIMTLMAIDALDADAATRHIVLISKPPHPVVVKTVADRIARSAKPFTICFIGSDHVDLPPNAYFARTLKDAAENAIERGIVSPVASQQPPPLSSREAWRIEGLFSGGTLCAEAQVVLSAGGRRVVSNVPIPGVGALQANGGVPADRMIDLGSDEYTRGLPHPMIDPTVRDDLLRNALADRSVAVVLLDVVLGYGAHRDPAGHLATVLESRSSEAPIIVASVTGTEQDPQVRSLQIERLRVAGVHVAPSNAQASELALRAASPRN